MLELKESFYAMSVDGIVDEIKFLPKPKLEFFSNKCMNLRTVERTGRVVIESTRYFLPISLMEADVDAMKISNRLTSTFILAL